MTIAFSSESSSLSYQQFLFIEIRNAFLHCYNLFLSVMKNSSPSLLSLTVNGETKSTLVYFHTHNDDRILLRIFFVIIVTMIILSVNNFFSLKYEMPSYTDKTFEYTQLYLCYIVSLCILIWYTMFLVATWFGRGFHLSQNEDAGEIAQPCVTRFQRTLGHGCSCWLPNENGWELFIAECDPSY